MLALKVRLSKAFISAFDNYEEYKKLCPEDFEHFISKLFEIRKKLDKIARTKKHLSKKVNYRNSKNLHYFVFQKHAVFFKITKTELQVKYFVATRRIKKDLF